MTTDLFSEDWDLLRFDGRLYYRCEAGHNLVSTNPIDTCTAHLINSAGERATPDCDATMDWVLVDVDQAERLLLERRELIVERKRLRREKQALELEVERLRDELSEASYKYSDED